MKLYAKEDVAKTVAAKKSEAGVSYVAVPHKGQFAIIKEGTVIEASPVVEATPKAKAKAKAEAVPEDYIVVFLPKARLTPNYIITPLMGSDKKERWIERKECKTHAEENGGVKAELPRKALTSRKINPQDFLVKAA